jgi:hypothetical protein
VYDTPVSLTLYFQGSATVAGPDGCADLVMILQVPARL